MLHPMAEAPMDPFAGVDPVWRSCFGATADRLRVLDLDAALMHALPDVISCPTTTHLVTDHANPH
jgi:hypothetical protein